MKTILLVFFFTGIFGLSNSFSQEAVPQWPEISGLQLSHNSSTIMLQWLAKSEPNGIYYEIERSEDGINYKTVGIVLGGFDKSDGYHYMFREQVKNTKFYYRIRQIHKDGSSRIAAERSV
ncbi:MAG TPA: hypothetical protein VFV46_12840 [Lacibacter sp.]|nr:hypothetical protein [Lacibacter sp.]